MEEKHVATLMPNMVPVDQAPKKPEEDPNAIGQHEPGAKLDSGKLDFGLILSGFPNALEHVTRVGMFGAVKYSPYGFLEVPDAVERYTSAMLRHWFEETKGNEYDLSTAHVQNTDQLHAACVAWNALARLELMLRKKTE